MELGLGITTTEAKAIPNFHNIDWEDLRDELQKQLLKVTKLA